MKHRNCQQNRRTHRGRLRHARSIRHLRWNTPNRQIAAPRRPMWNPQRHRVQVVHETRPAGWPARTCRPTPERHPTALYTTPKCDFRASDQAASNRL
jgi:hypothetical protein